WFEVKEGTGIPRVRVLQGLLSNKQEYTIDQLLQHLQLPQSKWSEALVRQLTAQHIPFTRQSLITGMNVLQQLSLDHEQGIDTLLNMMRRQLPITHTSVQAYHSIQSEPSIHQMLQRL